MPRVYGSLNAFQISSNQDDDVIYEPHHSLLKLNMRSDEFDDYRFHDDPSNHHLYGRGIFLTFLIIITILGIITYLHLDLAFFGAIEEEVLIPDNDDIIQQLKNATDDLIYNQTQSLRL